MSKKPFHRVSIAKCGYTYCDTIAIDPYSGHLIFASIVDTLATLKKIQIEVNRVNSMYIEEARQYVSTNGSKYDTDLRKQPNSEFAHLVANKKDNVESLSEDNELLTAYVYVDDASNLNNKIFDKLYKNTAIPLLEEWMEYIVNRMTQLNYLRELNVYSVHDNKPFRLYRVQISKQQLQAVVQTGLSSQAININGTSQASELMEFTDGLDSYLNIFGDTLAQKIQQSFEPKFNPETDSYDEYVENYDDSCYHNGIELYNAQRATVQAAVNNLKVNNVTFVIGEMGSGKTALGSGIAYAHYGKKSGMTNVVMCPSHLIEKWKREVERLVPNGKGYIIREIGDLINIERKIKNKHKLENSYLIISKETAKFSYEKRPCAIWSKSKRTFVCPCCGQVLTKKVKIGTGRTAYTEEVPFDMLDMLKPLSMNASCNNKVRRYSTKDSRWEEVECNTSLWAPLNKLDNNIGWVKLGKTGWIVTNHVDEIFNNLVAKNTLTKKEGELFARVLEVKNTLDAGEKLTGVRAPRKYSIAKYIRERFNGHIDYFLADELDFGSSYSDVCVKSV